MSVSLFNHPPPTSTTRAARPTIQTIEMATRASDAPRSPERVQDGGPERCDGLTSAGAALEVMLRIGRPIGRSGSGLGR